MSSALPPVEKHQRNDRGASTLHSGMISQHQGMRCWIPPGTVPPVTLIRQRSIMEPEPAPTGCGYAVIIDACEIQSIQVTILLDVPYSTCTRLPRSQVGGM